MSADMGKGDGLTGAASPPAPKARLPEGPPDGLPTQASIGITADPWPQLRALTPARLALGRAGYSLPTAEVLRFGLAHAQARDAVHHALDGETLVVRLREAGFRVQTAHSAASDRWQYLARPDLGRRLDDDSRQRLVAWSLAAPPLLVVIGDGLSAAAVEQHALPVLEAACALLASVPQDGATASAPYAASPEPVVSGIVAPDLPPVIVAREARVALGDDIGQCLGAGIVVVMIGERPGLSSPDSMGIYVTHGPRIGRSDAERNCISNVRPAGLPATEAARELVSLILRIRLYQCSGVLLPAGGTMTKAMGCI